MSEPKAMQSAGGWQVDRAEDPGVFVKYLEASSESALMRGEVSERMRKYAVHEARRIVDVGCGLGTHARMLAAHAPTGALVVGLDASASMLEKARRRAPGSVRFVRGDAHRLPLASATFELAWLERVLVHFANPLQTLREIRRILAPAGRVLIAEADYTGLLLDCEDERTWGTLKARWRRGLTNPSIGRQLRRLLRRAGFEQVQLDLELRGFSDLDLLLNTIGLERHTAALVTEGELDAARARAFWDEQRARQRDGEFFAAMPFVIAQARGLGV